MSSRRESIKKPVGDFLRRRRHHPSLHKRRRRSFQGDDSNLTSPEALSMTKDCDTPLAFETTNSIPVERTEQPKKDEWHLGSDDDDDADDDDDDGDEDLLAPIFNKRSSLNTTQAAVRNENEEPTSSSSSSSSSAANGRLEPSSTNEMSSNNDDKSTCTNTANATSNSSLGKTRRTRNLPLSRKRKEQINVAIVDKEHVTIKQNGEVGESIPEESKNDTRVSSIPDEPEFSTEPNESRARPVMRRKKVSLEVDDTKRTNGKNSTTCSDDNSTAPLASSTRQRNDEKKWECTACTLLNEPRFKRCSVCKSRRPPDTNGMPMVTPKASPTTKMGRNLPTTQLEKSSQHQPMDGHSAPAPPATKKTNNKRKRPEGSMNAGKRSKSSSSPPTPNSSLKNNELGPVKPQKVSAPSPAEPGDDANCEPRPVQTSTGAKALSCPTQMDDPKATDQFESDGDNLMLEQNASLHELVGNLQQELARANTRLRILEQENAMLLQNVAGSSPYSKATSHHQTVERMLRAAAANSLKSLSDFMENFISRELAVENHATKATLSHASPVDVTHRPEATSGDKNDAKIDRPGRHACVPESRSKAIYQDKSEKSFGSPDLLRESPVRAQVSQAHVDTSYTPPSHLSLPESPANSTQTMDLGLDLKSHTILVSGTTKSPHGPSSPALLEATQIREQTSLAQANKLLSSERCKLTPKKRLTRSSEKQKGIQSTTQRVAYESTGVAPLKLVDPTSRLPADTTVAHDSTASLDTNQDTANNSCRVQSPKWTIKASASKKNPPLGNSTNNPMMGPWQSSVHGKSFMDHLEQTTGTTRKEHPQSSSASKGWVTARSAYDKTKERTATSRDIWDDSQPNHKYQEVVRCKAERKGLPCRDCPDCIEFYDFLRRTGHDEFSQQFLLENSRHRARFSQPETPADFWEMDFIDEKRAREAAQTEAKADAGMNAP